MKFQGNLVVIGALLVFGLLATKWDDVSPLYSVAMSKLEKFFPEGTKWYPPGSPKCGTGDTGRNVGCFVIEGEPLEGIALTLALIGALVFVVAVVAYIIWSIKKQKRQKSLDSQNPS